MKTRLWGYDAEKEVRYIARILKDNNAIVIKDDGTIDYEETADNLISDCDLYRGSVLTALVLEDIYITVSIRIMTRCDIQILCSIKGRCME